jgi:hypothetical protein
MTVLVQNTEVTSTFDYWRTRTNELSYSMSKAAITTDGYLGMYSVTAIGNAAITGTFTANVVTSGNSTVNTTTNSTSFSISNTTTYITITNPTLEQSANNYYFLNANGSWSIPKLVLTTVDTAGTGDQLVDSWDLNTIYSAEYQISTIDQTANGYAAARVFVYHDTGSAYTTEYATMYSNATTGHIATFTANVDQNYVRLWAKPTRSNVKIKFVRIVV